MSDNSTDAPPTGPPADPPPTPDSPPAAEQPPPAASAGSLAELPEWAQTEIRKARTEAGKYRRERNTAQAALADRQDGDQDRAARAGVDQLTTELDTARRDNARLRAALAADIPPTQIADFAARLVGDTDEELAEDAKRLRELLGLAPQRRPDPSQGQGIEGGEQTPADAFAAFVQDRLNRQ